MTFVLYGCEEWSLKLREQRSLRVLENKALKRIFGPKRHANGDWRRLQNEERHNLHRSRNILRVIKSTRLKWAGHVARMEEGRSAFKITGTPVGKRPLGSPRRRLEGSITMSLKEIGINTRNWVDSVQDRDYWRAPVTAALNLQVPYIIELLLLLLKKKNKSVAYSSQGSHTGQLDFCN